MYSVQVPVPASATIRSGRVMWEVQMLAEKVLKGLRMLNEHRTFSRFSVAREGEVVWQTNYADP